MLYVSVVSHSDSVHSLHVVREIGFGFICVDNAMRMHRIDEHVGHLRLHVGEAGVGKSEGGPVFLMSNPFRGRCSSSLEVQGCKMRRWYDRRTNLHKRALVVLTPFENVFELFV
jgi:hypothetical protein